MRSARDVGWSTPDADADWGNDFLDARKARLGDVLEDLGTKTLKYLYDFGDGWEHTIKIERLTDPEPGIVYPRLTEVSGRCPPEDCGGPWGYAELIEAIKDPKHERHDELTEWIGDDFDPHADQAEWLTAKSMPSPRNGPASPQANSRDAPNPRPSPEGYYRKPRRTGACAKPSCSTLRTETEEALPTESICGGVAWLLHRRWPLRSMNDDHSNPHLATLYKRSRSIVSARSRIRLRHQVV